MTKNQQTQETQNKAKKLFTSGSILFILLLLTLLTTQCLYLPTLFSFYYSKNFTFRPFVLAIISTLVMCALFASFLYFNQKRKKRKEEEAAELKRLEEQHKLEIESTKTELASIQQGFNDKLRQIYELVQGHQSKEALQLSNELTQKLENTKEYTFCPNPVINSVLSDKQKRCKELGINFEPDLMIGTCESVKKIHLCSIFSNLLDNAIHACEVLPASQERTIRLSARESGDFLHIKVTNPTTAAYAKRKPGKGHGYGLSILKEIAKLYHGQFTTKYKKNLFEASISIECNGGEKE